MAPKKTTGKGKPAITKEEKAASFGLSVKDYEKRAKIGIEMRKLANDYISKNAKGQSDQKKIREVFGTAWVHAKKTIKDKYPLAELKRLQIKV